MFPYITLKNNVLIHFSNTFLSTIILSHFKTAVASRNNGITNLGLFKLFKTCSINDASYLS